MTRSKEGASNDGEYRGGPEEGRRHLAAGPPRDRGAVAEGSRGQAKSYEQKADLTLTEGVRGRQTVVGARAEQAQGVERSARVDRDARFCERDVVAAASETVARKVAAPSGRGGIVAAPPPPAKRRGVDVGTQSPRRKHKDDESPAPPSQKRRGVDAGTQSPKPRTTSTGGSRRGLPRNRGAPSRPRRLEERRALSSRRTRRSWPPSSPCRRRLHVAPDLEGEATKEQLEHEGAFTDGTRERARDQ